LAYTISGQEMERVYSFNPGAHTGSRQLDIAVCAMHIKAHDAAAAVDVNNHTTQLSTCTTRLQALTAIT